MPAADAVSNLQDSLASIIQTILMKIGAQMDAGLVKNIVALVVSMFT